MNSVKALSLLSANPKLFLNYLAYKIRALKPLPDKPLQTKINGVLFEFDLAYDPIIKFMYWGGYEIPTVEFMRKSLRPGDIFIDVGANIGYLTAIGAGLVGQTGYVHSFEPVPEYFNRLKKLATTNLNYSILVNNSAVGDADGRLDIRVSDYSNIGWNTMVPGAMSEKKTKEVLEVPVLRLDSYMSEKKLSRIAVIKIDVEGYEFRVLRGLSNYLENGKCHPEIICEIITPVYPLLGHSALDIKRYMEGYGYYAHSLIDNSKVDITKLRKATIVFRASR